MKTPLTKEALQHHFTYSWWKYLLLIAISIMGWSIIFAVTAYRAPEEKKIIVGVYTAASDANMQAYMDNVQAEHFPDMEEVDPMYILTDETYGAMILSTRVAARECDLYVLPRNDFQNYASQGGFMPIDVAFPALVADLEAAGVSLSRGWRTVEDTGEKHLYGIPCTDLPAASQLLGFDTGDTYISIFFETGNDENCMKFFEIFIRDLMKKPEEVVPSLQGA